MLVISSGQLGDRSRGRVLGGTHPSLGGRQCKHPPGELGALGSEPPKALSTGSCPSKLGERVRAFSALSPDSSSPEESSPAHPKRDPLSAARCRSSWCNRCSSGAVGSSSEQQGACARARLWLLGLRRAGSLDIAFCHRVLPERHWFTGTSSLG